MTEQIPTDILRSVKNIDQRLVIIERSGAGGAGDSGSPNLDGGTPTSVYDAIDNIDAGGV